MITVAMTESEAAEKLERARREAFSNLLKRWPDEVGVPAQRAWDATKVAADFGRLGLQSAILINGSALVVMPPLMQWLPTEGRTLLAGQATWFAAGVLLAALAVAVGYVNFTTISEALQSAAAKRAKELNAEYSNGTTEGDKEYAATMLRHRRFSKAANFTAVCAIALAVLSYACFTVGALGFMHLARLSPAATSTASQSPTARPTPGH